MFNKENFVNLVKELFKKRLEETSGAAAGSVAGFAGSKDDEVKLRKEIRKIISMVSETTKKEFLEEQKLRKFIRGLLREGKSVTTANPHHITGINELEKLLKNIVPIIEEDFKILTTSEGQRQSFRTQLLHSISNLLEEASVNPDKVDKTGSSDINESDDEDDEENNLRVVDDNNPYIPIDGETVEEYYDDSAEADFDTIDATGRSKALETLEKIQNQIIAAYAPLRDPIDTKAFKKYLMINLNMRMDKWESEISKQLSKINPEPDPDDVIDTDDGLSDDELGADTGDEMVPDDLEDDSEMMEDYWKEALNTEIELVEQ